MATDIRIRISLVVLFSSDDILTAVTGFDSRANPSSSTHKGTDTQTPPKQQIHTSKLKQEIRQQITQ